MRTKRPKQPSMAELQKQVDDFNQKYTIGDTVKLKTDHKGIQDAVVKYPASIMGNHTAVGWFKEFGSYDLKCVQ